MAHVFIPTVLQSLTDGANEVILEGETVRDLIEGLERLFPGIQLRLETHGRLARGVAVAVDGIVSRLGLLEVVTKDSEVHFVPSISGG